MYDRRFWSLTVLVVAASGTGMAVIAALPINEWLGGFLMVAYAYGIYQLAMSAR